MHQAPPRVLLQDSEQTCFSRSKDLQRPTLGAWCAGEIADQHDALQPPGAAVAGQKLTSHGCDSWATQHLCYLPAAAPIGLILQAMSFLVHVALDAALHGS